MNALNTAFTNEVVAALTNISLSSYANSEDQDQTPQNENRPVLLIRVGNSIQLKWLRFTSVLDEYGIWKKERGQRSEFDTIKHHT